jgi:hypothetical protein
MGGARDASRLEPSSMFFLYYFVKDYVLFTLVICTSNLPYINFKENLGSLCEYEVEEVGIGYVK